MRLPTTLKIALRDSKEDAQKVTAIKATRTLTGLGLKEAKEIIDNSYFSTSTADTSVTLTDSEFNRSVNTLRNAGFNVTLDNGQYEIYVEQLREMTSMATLKGDYYVAGRLIEFLETNF